jgi:endonuclease YncB( thermonuclease family)
VLLIATLSLLVACTSTTGESAGRVAPESDPAVTVDNLLVALLEELPADAARNMKRGEPTEAFAKGMSALLNIAQRNNDWNRAVAEVQSLASWLAIDLSEIDALVTQVIDGDTIIVMFADRTTATVRYADMDTPEVGNECASEATAFNRAMVDGKTVTLKLPFDSENRIDRYGRLVRHVWVYYSPANGEAWVNLHLVRQGLARHWGEAFHANGMLRPTASAEVSAMSAGHGCLWRQ